ncbi:hypothetical protein, partial [Campylobacter taeniopygiae]|uniref:hypothetical protein n=1 Tax=Campylobacter taeniopygiae TaxID=2510188 RepID=UPI003D6A37FA
MENFNSLNRFLNSKENLNSKSFSKKFLFSLAAVSVLATCANAQISGVNGCNENCATITNNQTGQITVGGSNNTNLTINQGVTLTGNSQAIIFNNNSSLNNFNNQGTIKNGGT